jgi:ElaB/YqjD/DUF883 family membrane-anchored ribosome-binding protein
VDNELEVIRHQMEEKRASLADKLDALETEVRATVHEATAEVSHIVQEVKSTVDSVTEGVQDTVESVKVSLTEGVQETVETVKQSLNVNDHVRRHPWLAVGSALAAGFAGGYLLGPSKQSPSRDSWSSRPTAGPSPEPAWSPPPARSTEPSSSWSESAKKAVDSTSSAAFAAIEEAGAEALTKVRELAVGTLMGVLGHVIGNALPAPLKDEASKLMKDLTTKLGGKVIDVSSMLEGRQDTDMKGDRRGNGYEAEMGRSVGSAPWEDQEPVGQSDRRRADAGRGGLRANDRSAQGANGKEP